MSEFEVETVTEARVAKKSKKVIWEYHVKWKGYTMDENTWEPIASFSGSEDIIEKFWERVDLNNRDRKNMTQFRVGETFLPVGPPRRKQSQRNLKSQPVASPPPSAGPSKETTTRSSKRRRSSPPAVESEEKPAKRTRGRVTESEAPPAEEPRAPRQPARRPPAKSTASSARSIRRTKKRSPSPQEVPASEVDEEEDVAMLVDPEPESAVDPPPQDVEDDRAIEARAEPPQETLPSHRARAAKPLVKMIDDFAPMDGAISVKARLRAQNATSNGETPVAGPSTTPRTSPRKPGPGRSSSGMLNKNTSSLLTFDKGALKTVKGKFKAPAVEEDRGEGASGVLDDGDAIVASPLAEPPTSDELLKLGGFDPKAAEALDDFEDEEVASPTAEETPSNPNQESLTLAKNKLFPPGTSVVTSVSNKLASVWRRATIFGPLGLGSDGVADTPSESKPFTLKLDATVILPLDLTDIHQSLDNKFSETTNGPTGKFYKGTNAVKLLDTVRAGGPSARVVLREDATDEQKSHFARFRSRLDEGDLFTMMIGNIFLGFASSNTPLMQRLNLPPSLVSFTDSVFLTELHIENLSEYLDAVDTADTSRW
ncbi:hypothetical protein C8F04DRAFT_1062141 [Mycena alexandri]|uniref:Chromo domain-containing protein n=1 Tax=Mycena alexandri TaxID=1745969 RepID=A0AAD6XEC7_9AGAR|nr:hypothetical protein C8F04DRAFT_1062141 [Mycena alexandri]